jgi:hypothetical protein
MAERPRINPDDLDRRVTDLGQYKKSRERAQRKVPPKPRAGGFLGSNPKAPLILAIVAAVLAALYVVPLFF